MAAKALNFKMDEMEIADIKHVATVYHKSITDVIKEGIREYVQKLKADPFYRLTANVEEADAEETAEILGAIDSLTDDDLSISQTRQFTV